jgi:hypothetical protein
MKRERAVENKQTNKQTASQPASQLTKTEVEMGCLDVGGVGGGGVLLAAVKRKSNLCSCFASAALRAVDWKEVGERGKAWTKQRGALCDKEGADGIGPYNNNTGTHTGS